MDVQVQIEGEIRTLSEARPEWINQQVNRRKADNRSVCVRVTIEDGPIHLTLTTPDCPRSGGSRTPNADEQRIVDLWRKHHLMEPEFTGGNVVSFLKQLAK